MPETLHGKDGTASNHRGCSLDEEDDWEHLINAIRATIDHEAMAVLSPLQISPFPAPCLEVGEHQRRGLFRLTVSRSSGPVGRPTGNREEGRRVGRKSVWWRM